MEEQSCTNVTHYLIVPGNDPYASVDSLPLSLQCLLSPKYVQVMCIGFGSGVKTYGWTLRYWALST